MPDRVKEAVFNILGSHYECPGALPPLLVADVFAGSGSMGLEALSRGAAACCFFERDRHALDALRDNVRALSAESASAIIVRDAWRFAVSDTEGKSFDLVFLDPPYRDSRDASDRGPVQRYLARLRRDVGKTPLVVLHHPSAVRYEPPLAGTWQIADHRTFGTNAITIFGP